MTTPTNRFAFPKPTDTDAADLPVQLGNIVEQVEDRLSYAGGRGGMSKIATSQTRTSTAYGFLGTPDRVQGIDAPDGGLILIQFSCEWSQTVASAAAATLLVGSTGVGSTAGASASLALKPMGTGISSGGVAGLIDQPIIGNNLAYILAVPIDSLGIGGAIAPGTYDVGVQFKATSGDVTARNRLLRVWTREFPASGV